MDAKYDLNDDSVVVIIGSGAGGGTLANELAQKNIKGIPTAVDRLRRAGAGVLGVEEGDLHRRRAPAAVLDRPVDADPPLGGEACLPPPAPRDLLVDDANDAAAARRRAPATPVPRRRTPPRRR